MSESGSSVLPIIVKRPFWQWIVPLLGSAIASLLAIYALLERGAEWLPWIIAVLFGGWATYSVENRINGKPRLIISEDGINVDYWNSRVRRWEEFHSARLQDQRGAQYLCLTLHDSDAYHSTLNPVMRAIHTATLETGFGDLTIDLSEMRLDAPAILVVVKQLIEAARANPKPASSVYYPRGK